ncbi:Uncharacterised protein [uncultured archaeon]|nr:Uncharacterised protein [uncultured archaeon]
MPNEPRQKSTAELIAEADEYLTRLRRATNNPPIGMSSIAAARRELAQKGAHELILETQNLALQNCKEYSADREIAIKERTSVLLDELRERITPQEMPMLERAFETIRRMDKSGTMGDFYGKISQSQFPFAEKFLRESVKLEKIPNGNLMALIGYLQLAAQRTGLPHETLALFKKRIGDYTGKLEWIKRIREMSNALPNNVRPKIPKEMIDTLRFASTRNTILMEDNAGLALSAIVFFRIKPLVLPLSRALELELRNKRLDKPTAQRIAQTAAALRHLTGNPKYMEEVERVGRLLRITPSLNGRKANVRSKANATQQRKNAFGPKRLNKMFRTRNVRR